MYLKSNRHILFRSYLIIPWNIIIRSRMNWGIKSQGRCPLLSDDMGSVHDIPQFENDVIPRHSLSMSCTRNINIHMASHFYLIKKIHALNIFIEQAYIGNLIFQIYLHSCFFYNRKIGIYLRDFIDPGLSFLARNLSSISFFITKKLYY